jgi:hypothetical protein
MLCESRVETFSDTYLDVCLAVAFLMVPLIGGLFELVSDSQRHRPAQRRL